jgi:pimeloyl-ACP methyl ester carboxylesterase
VLLLWGREDRLVPLRRSERLLRRLPQARLHVLERCGHLPMLEQPTVFHRAMRGFLRVALDEPFPFDRPGAGVH